MPTITVIDWRSGRPRQPQGRPITALLPGSDPAPPATAWLPSARREEIASPLPPLAERRSDYPRGLFPPALLPGSPSAWLPRGLRPDFVPPPEARVDRRSDYPRGLFPPALLPGSPSVWVPTRRREPAVFAWQQEGLLLPAAIPPKLPPALLPGYVPLVSVRTMPLLPRVPEPGDPDYERRMARFTEKLHSLINSLIRQGQLAQTGPTDWTLNPGGGVAGSPGSGLTGTFPT